MHTCELSWGPLGGARDSTHGTRVSLTGAVQIQKPHPEGMLPGGRVGKPEKVANGEWGKRRVNWRGGKNHPEGALTSPFSGRIPLRRVLLNGCFPGLASSVVICRRSLSTYYVRH